MGLRRVGAEGVHRRRSGPADERQWWDPADQLFVQQPLLDHREFPRGWRPAIMVNNQEVLDPYEGGDAASIRRARAVRTLSALDEGAAYRARNRQLLVLRTEVFRAADDSEHRAAWQADGAAALTSTYRARWAERGVAPNWIETLIRRAGELPGDVDPRVDWLRVEDHTDPKHGGVVSIYEHLTLWCKRAHAVVTVRHEPDQHLEEMALQVVHGLLGRLEALPTTRGGDVRGS